MTTNESNMTIAKNTLILYVRSFVMMVIGIFTSRIILEALGVSDFGLYGTIGSMVAMFTIINGVLSAGSSRFLTFELGRNDPVRLKKTFNASFGMHCSMAGVLFILFETVGLWFVNNKLNIPAGREFATNVVYQISILTCLMSITQVPYGAVIIAHERFDIFAYVGIGEALFKLILPLCLVYCNFGDNLIAYAVICALWTIGLQIFYRIYCYKRYLETHLSLCCDKGIYKNMLSYSLWDLVGQFCVTGNSHGVNILINIFFGTTINASRSVAYTVEDKVTIFNNNFITSVVPQITKSYAQRNYKRFFELINESGKISFYLIFLITLPVFIEAEYLLSLWLVEVPPMAVLFLRIIMIHIMLRAPARPLVTGVHATGDVRFLNLTCGLVCATTYLPTVYFLYKIGLPAWSCYIPIFVLDIVSNLLEAYSLKRKAYFSLGRYFIRVYLIPWLIIVPTIFVGLIPRMTMSSGLLRCASTGFLSVLATVVAVYTMGISQEYREKIKFMFLKFRH